MAYTKNILLVGSDETLNEILMENFNLHDEFCLKTSEGTNDIVYYIEEYFLDIALIDITSAGEKIIEIFKLIQGTDSQFPILLISDAGLDFKSIIGSTYELTDYIVKPFKFVDLISKLRSQINAFERSDAATFAVGSHLFHPSTNTLFDNEKNKEVRLTEKESAILNHLYRSRNKIVSRSTLLQQVWGYNANIATHTLETHIYRLRQKLEQSPPKARILVTELGGYRLVI